MNEFDVFRSSPLLAQDDVYIETPIVASNPIERVAAQVRGRVERASILDVGIVLAVVIAAVGLIWCLSRWNRRLSQPSKNPEWLFRDLCKAHQLSGRAISLLRGLAAANHQPPAMAFVMPQWFEGDRIPGSLKSNTPEFAELARHLFR